MVLGGEPPGRVGRRRDSSRGWEAYRAPPSLFFTSWRWQCKGAASRKDRANAARAGARAGRAPAARAPRAAVRRVARGDAAHPRQVGRRPAGPARGRPRPALRSRACARRAPRGRACARRVLRRRGSGERPGRRGSEPARGRTERPERGVRSERSDRKDSPERAGRPVRGGTIGTSRRRIPAPDAPEFRETGHGGHKAGAREPAPLRVVRGKRGAPARAGGGAPTRAKEGAPRRRRKGPMSVRDEILRHGGARWRALVRRHGPRVRGVRRGPRA